jgi:molecular chaperone GrpE
MIDPNKQDDDLIQPDGQPDAEPAAPGPAAEEQPLSLDIQQQFAALQKERDELESRLLRVAADYQNYARRSEQNITSAREQQVIDMARRLLHVMDHFDHAVEVDPDKTSTQDLLQGVMIVRTELLQALNSFGVQRVEVQPGEPFDPNRHEALMRQESERVESDHVTMQLNPGYMLGDKVIRPARVAVAE